MIVVGKPILVAFVRKHADARSRIEAWLAEVEAAAWRSPHDVKQRYPTVDQLGNGILVFNIKGNKYRLAVKVWYDTQMLRVLEIGTHAEYDRWTF